MLAHLGTCVFCILAFNGTSDYTIVAGSEPTPAEQLAVEEFRTHLTQITGCDIPCKTDVVMESPMIIVGPGKALTEIAPDLDWEALDKEELVIRTKGKHLILVGGRPRGTLYAVYEFLEKYLNCRWYTKDVVSIPKQSSIQLEAIDYSYNPPIMYREVLYKNAFEREFSARQRLNGSYHELDESTGGTVAIFPYVHTFATLVPPGKYFESHPEYFALIDGKRVPDKQLCLTDPDVLRITTEKVFSWIEERPDIEIFEVSQNDGYGPCECEKCQAIVKEEGSEMGPILRFVNAVADEVAKKHPGKYIDTLSYAYSETPPLITKPRDNVIIRLCHWAPACGVHGISTCPTNEVYRQELDGWKKISTHTFIWDYMVTFGAYLAPYPNWWSIGDDTRYYAENRVHGVMWQGSYQSLGGEMSDLRAYIAAQMLWHPDQDVDAVIDDFLNGFYGSAARPIREYLEMLRDYVVKENICRMRSEVKLTPEMMTRAQNLFNKAENLAASKDIFHRVRKARASIQFQQLCYPKEYELNYQEACAMLNALAETVKREGITHVRESRAWQMEEWLKQRQEELNKIYNE